MAQNQDTVSSVYGRDGDFQCQTRDIPGEGEVIEHNQMGKKNRIEDLNGGGIEFPWAKTL